MVSIPNGMEFYLAQKVFFIYRVFVSIPNGMEFYRNNLPKIRLHDSFNSQRDGILPRYDLLYERWALVSIPNGMEFYSISYFYLLFNIQCFNSQRDGILQGTFWWMSALASVSIPNGMEFYQIRAHAELILLCFNSQRDGILPVGSCVNKCEDITFQFPTGWNSTTNINGLKFNSSEFQFPTGWNSTLLKTKTDTESGCFNSQRDGILQFEG